MNIRAFYQHSRCEKISGMERLLYEENRYGVYQKVIELMCTLLKQKLSHYDILQWISLKFRYVLTKLTPYPYPE